MRVNKIDFHFSKLRYQPDFEHFSDEEFQQIKEHTVLRSYKKDRSFSTMVIPDNGCIS